ncbi:SusC/RagA family TonB-linked outer membrane protein [Mucilaginibacter hurinus]|uniref:SusC/RagA family TonB-linked outer membrane protein n=1 Tax=Mucilaginibacter hurinus TaxID=2201324 RepID=UPI001314782C|nr:SusC/RagA family TonB-linked outer membrane protein [Mucilaginibacter hurinus]
MILFLTQSSLAAVQQDTTGAKKKNVVSGLVIDADAHPIKGASVNVKGDTSSISTDEEGLFEIAAPVGSVLTFKAPNFNTMELSVKNTDSLVVRLIDTYIQNPDDIVLLYETKKKSALLGSVSTIYTNQLTPTNSSLFLHALPGQLAGLNTTQVGGFSIPTVTNPVAPFVGLNFIDEDAHNMTPSDNSEFNLLLRGQAPVTIIDGIQRDITGIDMENIESISVLKDALSTMFLGINSSRGVLLVTTKRARAGKPRITFTAQAGVQQNLGLPKDPLSAYEYAYLYNEALSNDGQPARFSAADFAGYRSQSNPIQYPDINWNEQIIRNNAPIQNYKLNVNGGSERAKYTISMSYFNQDGLFKTSPDVKYNSNTNLNRYIINSSISVKVTKNLDIDLQLYGRIIKSNQPGGDGNGDFRGVLGRVFYTPNNAYPIRNPNGSLGGTIDGPFQNNLLAMSQLSGYIQNNAQDILANLDIRYSLDNFVKGLAVKVKGNLAFQSLNTLNRSLRNPTFFFRNDQYGVAGTALPQNNSFYTTISSRFSFVQGALTYDRQFKGKHNVSAMLMTDGRFTALTYDLSGKTLNTALKASYNYDEKYYAEATVNRSSYNRYNDGYNAGTFYAFGIGWQMANESFMKDISWIDSWKWRAVYGRTGNNNIDAFQYYGYLQTYAGAALDTYPVGTQHSGIPTTNESPLANPYITFEKANKFNIGTDISIAKNKLTITADFYRDRYFDLLQVRGNNIALLGTPYTAENLGITVYKGGELTMTYQNNIDNLNYFISGNASIVSSKRVFMDEPPYPYDWMRRTGLPATASFGYQALGLVKDSEDAASSASTPGYTLKPGDIKYADLNSDNVIDRFDQKAIAGLKPLWFYGTSLGINYKGFSVSVILQGVFNRQINSTLTTTPFLGQPSIFGYIAPWGQAYSNAYNRWTPETASTATLPRLSLGNGNNSQYSTFFIKSGNYFRVKNAEIGYNLPYNWIRGLKISGIRVFANGTNLWTIAGYKGIGIDPEVYFGNSGNFPYPIQRVISAGVSVKL